MRKKQLYEAMQVAEARIKALEGQLYSTGGSNALRINPNVSVSADYNIALRASDKIQAVNRYITDIPALRLPSNRLEALFYDYGSLCFFQYLGKCRVATYAKVGKLNGLGDLEEVQPIDFAGKSYPTHFVPVYNDDLQANPCVIINDWTGTYLEDNVYPRAAINSCSIADQAMVYKQLRNSVKITAKRAIALVQNESQREAVEQSVAAVLYDDSPILSVIGDTIDKAIQLTNLDTKIDFEGYFRAIQCYENLRANFNGIHTRTPMDKKERLITSEAESDNCITDVYLYDGLINRQIGIELMKQHSIIKEGSCRINPIINGGVSEDNDENSNKLENKRSEE